MPAPEDLEAVRRIACEVGSGDGPVIAGPARAHPGDIAAAWEAVREARKPGIHTVIASSDLHLEHKLHLSRAQVLDRARAMLLGHSLGREDAAAAIEDAVEGVLAAGLRTADIAARGETTCSMRELADGVLSRL